MKLRLSISIILLLLMTSVPGLEINVLKAPEGRKHIWCFQSPFDNKVQYYHYFDGGSSGIRVTLVSGKEGQLFRFHGLRSHRIEGTEDFPDIESFSRTAGKNVELLYDDERIIVRPGSRLAEELLEAYEVHVNKWRADARIDRDIESFVLEPLFSEPYTVIPEQIGRGNE
jgi:hypothetical protein